MRDITKNILTVLLAFFLMAPAFAQDNRRLETKVADLLAQFPAQNGDHTSKLMLQMIETGAPGISKFCDMIVAPGTGNDSQARMALESLAQYGGAPNREKDRQLVEAALLAGLAKAQDKDVKAFFICRLPYCGGTQTVAQMEKYLNSADLYDPALSTLLSIGTPEAGAMVLANTPDKKDLQLRTMVKTLGQLKYQPAEPYLIGLNKSANVQLQKQVLAALANMGGTQSYKTFTTAAESAQFQPDQAETMIAYLHYANRLAELNESNMSHQLCAAVMKKCTQDNQLVYRSSALAVPGFGNNELFLKEIKHQSKVYRNAVLTNAAAGLTSGDIGPWIAGMKKASAERQAEILHFLANRPEGEVLQNAILPSLSSAAAPVRLEAIRALAINLKQKAVPVLIDQLKKANSDNERMEIERGLLNTCSANETGLLIAQLGEMDDAGKKVLINVLGKRRATDSFAQIINHCHSENVALRTAAFEALEKVSKTENAPALMVLLKNTTDKGSVKNIQHALVAIYSGTTKPDANLVLKEIQNGDMNDKLIPVLSSLNDAKALKTVVGLLKTGSRAEQEAAFVSLSNWKDASAAPHLFACFTNPDMKSFRMQALKSYLRITLDSDLPEDQKLLMIRKLMPQCTSVAEKTPVIQAAQNVKTFLSLVFAADYLDDPQLGATAAAVVKSLALPSSGKKNGLSGEFVREVLTKAMGKMTGPDSQYDVIDVREYLEKMPHEKGYVSLFNGTDLSGWQGLVKDPIARARMKPQELAKAQLVANTKMLTNWSVREGAIYFSGEGDNLCTKKMYGDFEMIVDWKISRHGDSGIYLRGTPQVQIWDTSRVDVGAQVGSGGLYNNQKHPDKPLVLADNAIGDWNTFRILMVGELVTVYLNGILVVDKVVMENYWDRSMPIFKTEAIELQAHGTDLAFRNIFVKELNLEEVKLSAEEESAGFKLLFNGKNLDNWIGNKVDYVAENGLLVVSPREGAHGNLFTEKEYSDFIFRFEFQLTPGANNGLGIHAPLDGDVAYAGKELQILDNNAAIYKDLEDYQYHGSVYGVMTAKKGFLKPLGEWNYQEVVVKGDDIKITLNGTVILEGNMKEASKNGTLDHKDHPGLLRNKGYIGFLGHGSELKFRNIRIKE